MFKFPNGQRYYTFIGKGYKKFWYEDANGNEFYSTNDVQVQLVYTN